MIALCKILFGSDGGRLITNISIGIYIEVFETSK